MSFDYNIGDKVFNWLFLKPFCFFGGHKFVVDKSKPKGYRPEGRIRVACFEASCIKCGANDDLGEDGFPLTSMHAGTIGELQKPNPPNASS